LTAGNLLRVQSRPAETVPARPARATLGPSASLERHRDISFQDLDTSLAPISVIITSLTSRSYEFCIRDQIYDSELELRCVVVRNVLPWSRPSSLPTL
jgi:hypothetical protein